MSSIDREIKEAEYFRVHDGPVIPTLGALRAYLRMIPERQFDYHVNAQKNDFASWVEHVFGETALAAKLRAARSREEMVWAIDDAFADEHIAAVMADKSGEQQAGAQSARQQASPQVVGGQENADPVRFQDDNAFDGEKGSIVGANEHISAKYEEVAKRFKESLQDPMPADLERLTERLKERHADLAAKITEARKLGRDALMPALVMRQFAPKLAFAIASRDTKDYAAAEAVLNQVQLELDEVMSAPIQDFRKEVLALAGVEDKSGDQTASRQTTAQASTGQNAYKH